MLKKILIISLSFAVVNPLYGEGTKFTEGMRQTDFVRCLIKEANLEKLLSSNPVDEDYFKLLSDLGISPPQGWDKDEIITIEDVIYMLGYSEEETEGFDFEQLSNQLVSLVKEIASYSYEEYLFEE